MNGSVSTYTKEYNYNKQTGCGRVDTRGHSTSRPLSAPMVRQWSVFLFLAAANGGIVQVQH